VEARQKNDGGGSGYSPKELLMGYRLSTRTQAGKAMTPVKLRRHCVEALRGSMSSAFGWRIAGEN